MVMCGSGWWVGVWGGGWGSSGHSQAPCTVTTINMYCHTPVAIAMNHFLLTNRDAGFTAKVTTHITGNKTRTNFKISSSDLPCEASKTIGSASR